MRNCQKETFFTRGYITTSIILCCPTQNITVSIFMYNCIYISFSSWIETLLWNIKNVIMVGSRCIVVFHIWLNISSNYLSNFLEAMSLHQNSFQEWLERKLFPSGSLSFTFTFHVRCMSTTGYNEMVTTSKVSQMLFYLILAILQSFHYSNNKRQSHQSLISKCRTDTQNLMFAI